MANSVIVRHGMDKSDEHWKCFPPFLWLLRDLLVHMPVRDGRQLTPTEYLKTEVLGGYDSNSIKTTVRKSLDKCFPSFECRTLPPPSTDPTVMENVSTSIEKLDSLFKQGVDELIVFVKQNTKSKKIFNAAGTECDGPILVTFVEELTSAVNDPHSIPSLESMWNMVVETRCKAVQESLLLEYSNTIRGRYDEISKGGPLEELGKNSLMEIHDTIWSEVKKKLNDEVGPLSTLEVTKECTLDMVTDQLEKQLIQIEWKTDPCTQDSVRKIVGGALFPIAEENYKRSKKFCNQLFTELYTPIKERVQRATGENGYTSEQLAADVESLYKEYDARSIGPEKWNVRAHMEATIEKNAEFFQKHLHEVSQRAKKEREHKQQVENLQNELKELKESRKEIDERLDDLKKHMQEADERRQHAVETEIKELKEKVEEQQQKQEAMNEKELKRRAEDAQRLTEEMFKREKVEEDLKVLENTLKTHEERESIRKAKADEEIKKMQQSIAENKEEQTGREKEAGKEIDTLNAQIKEWQQKLEQKKVEHETQKAEADAKLKKMEESLTHQKNKDKEEEVKQRKKLEEKARELHDQQLLIKRIKADHELMMRKIEAEKKEETRLKEQAKEDASITFDRLNQVIEDEKTEKEVQKRKWEKQFSEKEKEKLALSCRIDTLTDKIEALAVAKESLSTKVETLTEENVGLSRKVVADEGVIADEGVKEKIKKLNADIEEYEQKSLISRIFSPSVRK